MKGVDKNFWVHTARGRPAQWLRDHAQYQDDDCLIWPFCRHPNHGRGYIARLEDNGMFLAHRVLCEYVHGPAPDGKPQVRHSCGNGHLACMNPRHLSWCSQSENHMDRRQHGTAITNSWGRFGKLSREQIDAIRAVKGKERQYATAARFGISQSNVRYWQASSHYPQIPSNSPRAVRLRKQKRPVYEQSSRLSQPSGDGE